MVVTLPDSREEWWCARALSAPARQALASTDAYLLTAGAVDRPRHLWAAMPAPDLFLYCREQILVTSKYTAVLKEFEKAVLRAASSFPMYEDILLDYAMRWFQVSTPASRVPCCTCLSPRQPRSQASPPKSVSHPLPATRRCTHRIASTDDGRCATPRRRSGPCARRRGASTGAGSAAR